MSRNKYDLGKVAVTPGGAWDEDKPFERLTAVLYTVESGGDGCGYISLKDNVGVRPGTDPTTWQKSAEAGQSIYQLAVKYHAFVGTEEEFVAEYIAAVRAAEEAAAAANNAAGRANAAAGTAEQIAQTINALMLEWVAAESNRQAAENARQAAETERENEFSHLAAASQAATSLAGEAAHRANEAAEEANGAAEEAEEAAETTRQMNAGLIGLSVEDGELVLTQNAETGTVTGGEIDSDGMVQLEFEV